MNPGKIAGANWVFGAPPDWDAAAQGDCGALPVLNLKTPAGTQLQSAWFPSPEELGAMNQGCPVILTIHGKSHPVVEVGVAPVPGAAEMMCDHGHTIAEGCKACEALGPPGAKIDREQVDPRIFVPGSRKKQ